MIWWCYPCGRAHSCSAVPGCPGTRRQGSRSLGQVGQSRLSPSALGPAHPRALFSFSFSKIFKEERKIRLILKIQSS